MPSSSYKNATQAKAVFDAIYAARDNPYIRRLLEDAELRDTIRAAFTSGQDAYKRVQKAKTPQKVVLDDKKFHRDLAQAAEALRDASMSIRGKSQRSNHLGKAVVLIGLLALAALAASSELREKVLDLLFGAEEEFEYMSTTAAPPVSADQN